VFAEAEHRDPDHRRAWVTLVDGNNHQIPRIEAEARNRSVADRMDITGARWSVSGAEAVLKPRAVNVNSDLDSYRRYHLHREWQRIHQSRYTNEVIPFAAPPSRRAAPEENS
jgi:hypothetical protein